MVVSPLPVQSKTFRVLFIWILCFNILTIKKMSESHGIPLYCSFKLLVFANGEASFFAQVYTCTAYNLHCHKLSPNVAVLAASSRVCGEDGKHYTMYNTLYLLRERSLFISRGSWRNFHNFGIVF